MKIIKSIIHFFYPLYCFGCGKRISDHNDLMVCEKCCEELPRFAGYEMLYQPNKRFEGLVPYTELHCDLIFTRGSVVQSLIHQIKYKGQSKLGYKWSSYFAPSHVAAGHYADVSFVIPIPLLEHRYRMRGYNQSTFIARGLADALGLEVREDLLKRRGKGSQTRRSKQARWEAGLESFYCPHPEALQNKRVLLVDDVLTTGATLTHAARALYEEGGVESVSFYTLALDI